MAAKWRLRRRKRVRGG
uniref:Uncharacterized protein n=1 Tax=Zea mays TaxID=4577 RepID=C4J864_MAIZE|nr:unknown [Zea mays]